MITALPDYRITIKDFEDTDREVVLIILYI